MNNACSLPTSCKTRPVFSCDFQLRLEVLVSWWEAAGGAYSKHQRGGTHGTWKAALRGQTEAGQELTDIFWTTSILYPRTRSIILTFKQTQLREKAPSSQRHFKFLAREVKDRSLSLLQELSTGRQPAWSSWCQRDVSCNNTKVRTLPSSTAPFHSSYASATW